jgi:hypothetical protein
MPVAFKQRVSRLQKDFSINKEKIFIFSTTVNLLGAVIRDTKILKASTF